MPSYNTNQLKPGIKVKLEDGLYSIVENEFVKPGKGQAFNRVKMKNMISGRVIERTMKSGDSLEGADVAESEVQYLSNDGTHWHFMHPESYEQFLVSKDIVQSTAKWIKDQDMCNVVIFEGTILSVVPPIFVNLRVTETEPGVKGDTVSGGSKNAVLETGATVRVPLFVNIGDTLKIDTRTEEYVSRSK